MRNARTMESRLAEEVGAMPPGRCTVEEYAAGFAAVFFLYELAHGEGGHIPGDTTTPPAPGAVWIGSGDA